MPTCYSRTDVTSVAIPATGHLHAKEDGHRSEDGTRMAITCDACEPHLLTMGWKHNAAMVELTPDEQRASEDAESQTRPYMLELAKAMAEAARGQALAARTAV